jgi:hypothetical protein
LPLGRHFAYGVDWLFTLGSFLAGTEKPNIQAMYVFVHRKYIKLIGLGFGRVFHKLIWSLCSHQKILLKPDRLANTSAWSSHLWEQSIGGAGFAKTNGEKRLLVDNRAQRAVFKGG